jgi:hypothetical protein
MEPLRLLINMLEVADGFNTEWIKEFEQEFAIGTTTQVKIPQSFLIRNGLGYTPQAINRLTTTINCNNVIGVDFEWDSFEEALNMERSKEEIRRQYLEPAAAQIAQEVDSQAALFAIQNTNNIVGQLGTDPISTTTFAQARQRLLELACPPKGMKKLIIPPQVSTSMVPALQTLFNPTREVEEQYRKGYLGGLHGFEVYECMSLWRQTAGTQSGATTVNTANPNHLGNGNQIGLNSTAGDTLNVGDVITIASVNQVNPRTRRFLTPITKQFVVLQPYGPAAGGGANADFVVVSPAIFGPGSQYQNVDALPGNTATVTVYPGTTSPSGKSGAQGIAFHEDAFGLATVRLDEPRATELTSQTRDPKTRIAMRFVRMFDPIQSKYVNRYDSVFGFGQLYADACAVRLLCA